MKLSLEDKNWKEFSISELFEIISGKDITERERVNGETPFITATSENNGIGDYVGNVNKTLEARCISVNRTGSVGYAFYHPYEALYSNNCRKLRPKQELSDLVLGFITAQINKQRGKYSYGYILGTGRLKRQKIVLPANSQGYPDYVFMEAYMKQKEQEKLDKYKVFVSQRLTELQDYKDVEPLEDKEWGEFVIEDLFTIKIGKNVDGNKINKQGGKTAYVTRKEIDNGLDGFISYDKVYLNSSFPVITVGNETAQPFVQQYPFFTGTKVNILSHRDEVSLESYKFIAQCLEMHKSKYSYSFTANSTRLKRQKIMLPMNNQNQPDYEYMENYMKRLEYKKLKKYANYKLS